MNNPAPGYNPLRWNCDDQGCFNKKKRPKIEIFAECFPGRINFSDVDGIVEISGNALLMEWKPGAVVIPDGQRIMYERLTVGRRFNVICIAGDAEKMLVSHRAGFVDGKWRDWIPANLDEVKRVIAVWAKWARSRPRVGQ